MFLTSDTLSVSLIQHLDANQSTRSLSSHALRDGFERGGYEQSSGWSVLGVVRRKYVLMRQNVAELLNGGKERVSHNKNLQINTYFCFA